MLLSSILLPRGVHRLPCFKSPSTPLHQLYSARHTPNLGISLAFIERESRLSVCGFQLYVGASSLKLSKSQERWVTRVTPATTTSSAWPLPSEMKVPPPRRASRRPRDPSLASSYVCTRCGASCRWYSALWSALTPTALPLPAAQAPVARQSVESAPVTRDAAARR